MSASPEEVTSGEEGATSGGGALPVYMDGHATTAVDPRVLEEMLPFFGTHFGNAASRSHRYGWAADNAVQRARGHVARWIGGLDKEIVFTSGATESNNLAIKGVIEAAPSPAHIVTQETEHKSVLDACAHAERHGARITRLPVDAEGLVDPSDVGRALAGGATLLSVMLANNEVGAIQRVAEIGALAKRHGVLFHCDAAQGVALDLDVQAAGVDLVSLSAHKLYGPKGVGALWVRRRGPRVQLVAQLDGGGHERGRRSGTLNVPGIVGFGEAARLAASQRSVDYEHAATLRDRLQARLEGSLDGLTVHGPAGPRRHPGNLNLSFEHVGSEALLLSLKDVVALSSGAACASASREPSYVLRAMSVDPETAHASVRFGLGRFNTLGEVDRVADAVIARVTSLRERSPLYRYSRRGE